MIEYSRIIESLRKIYGEPAAQAALEKLQPVIEKFSAEQPARKAAQAQGYFSERDEVLITYGDSLSSQDEPPLQSLYRFAAEHLQELFSAILILPFFPFSSDYGFSVIDYLEVRVEEEEQKIEEEIQIRMQADLLEHGICSRIWT